MGNQSSSPFDLQRLSSAFFSATNDARLREAISRVSRDTHLHRTQLPPGPGENGLFTIDPVSPAAAPLIRVALALDANLQVAHARVVPDLASDAVFWTAYFLRVSEVLTAVGSKTPSTEVLTGTQSTSALAATSPSIARPSVPVSSPPSLTVPEAAPATPASAPLGTIAASRAPAPAPAPAPEPGSEAPLPLDESLLLTQPEVFVYRLPPRPSARGHVAASWGLDSPLATGYLRVVAATAAAGAAPSAAAPAVTEAGEISVAIWTRPDASQGGGGRPAAPPAAAASTLSLAPLLSGHRLVAVCRIPTQDLLPPPPTGGGPGAEGADALPPADDSDAASQRMHAALARFLEPVADSSRYFVMRAASSGGFLGFGYRDRQGAFDLRAALTDHCLRLRRQQQLGTQQQQPWQGATGSEAGGGAPEAQASAAPSPFALPEGATIHVTLQQQQPSRKGGLGLPGPAAPHYSPAAPSSGAPSSAGPPSILLLPLQCPRCSTAARRRSCCCSCCASCCSRCASCSCCCRCRCC